MYGDHGTGYIVQTFYEKDTHLIDTYRIIMNMTFVVDATTTDSYDNYHKDKTFDGENI